MVTVKICGVTTFEDALASAEAGADMLGLNFYRRSPRWIEPDAARALADGLRQALGPRCPLLVGVFVDDVVGRVSETMEYVGLNFAQLSGSESGEMLREMRGIAFKALRPRDRAEALADAGYYAPYAPADARCPSLLVDAYHPALYGGTGEQTTSEVALAVREIAPRLMLAGGLNPVNVAHAVRVIRPWGVDVASGVESGQPGRKDIGKVRAFIQAARSVI